MTEIWINKAKPGISFLWTIEQMYCETCNKSLFPGDTAFNARYFSRHGQKELIRCMSHIPTDKDRPFLEGEEQIRLVHIVEIIPTGCQLVPFCTNIWSTPFISMSTIEAALIKDSESITNDRTKYAKHESWEGATIGASDTPEKIEEKDRPLSIEEVGDKLLAIKEITQDSLK